MKPTLCVYFTDTIAEKVAHLLQAPNVGKGLASTQEAIEDFVPNVDSTLYSAVIVLGEYSGRDQDKLRHKTTINPAWRNITLINYTKTTLTPLFPPSALLKHAVGHGNSYCNYLSLLMTNHWCNLPYSFIHIPKSMPSQVAAREIDEQLVTYQKLCITI